MKRDEKIETWNENKDDSDDDIFGDIDDYAPALVLNRYRV